MKRRMLTALMLLALLTPPGAVRAQGGWTRPVVCCDNRIGCQVLQMVMMGSFELTDPDDMLSVRVLSAAYPKIKGVTEADAEHFMEEFDVEADVLRREYYIALGCCLWADILMGAAADTQEEEARQVLLLFLDPSSSQTAQHQMDIIRAAADETVYAEMAERLALDKGFVRYLMESEDWRSRESALPAE